MGELSSRSGQRRLCLTPDSNFQSKIKTEGSGHENANRRYGSRSLCRGA